MKNHIVWGLFLLLIAPGAFAAELTQISLHAPSVQQGAPITLTYTLVDDTDIGLVKTEVFLENGINHQESEQARNTVYKHSQTFILPSTYSTEETVDVRISVADQFPIIASIPLRARETTAQAHIPVTTSETGIAILVDPVRDVVPGDAIYYRAQIINTGDQARYVTIGLSDVSSWATYRVDPQPTVRVDPQEVHEAYIYLKVDADAPAGTTYFDVTATYDNVEETAGVRLAVIQPLQQRTVDIVRPWIIGIALILVVLAALYLLYTQLRKQDNNGGDDDDFITYY